MEETKSGNGRGLKAVLENGTEHEVTAAAFAIPKIIDILYRVNEKYRSEIFNSVTRLLNIAEGKEDKKSDMEWGL